MARARVEIRRLVASQERPAEAMRLRWAAAGLLVVVGLVSAIVVPEVPGADAAPRFDMAAVAASADPPAAAVPAVTATGPVAAPEVQPINVPLPLKPTVPVGKGMWIHRLDKASAGNIQSLVDAAVSRGLTHLYVRLGSSRMGFYAQRDLDALLPVAHAAGIKVVGWDFPYLDDVAGDIARAATQINYVTPSGDRIDAFASDIETPAEGTNLSARGASDYGREVRMHAGPQFPLIVAVPRPNPKRWYPYAEATASFDAIAPMVYWVNRDPAADVAGAIQALAHFGKPILPVGQAYDPGIDGSNSWGPPSAGDLHRFMKTAADLGVASYSFWAWDTASAEQWEAIASSDYIDLKPLAPGPELATRVTALQRVLKGLGRQVPLDGDFGPHTQAALADLQRQLGVPATGAFDRATLVALRHPR